MKNLITKFTNRTNPLLRDQRGITGLETAIVLIAFVVVSSVVMLEEKLMVLARPFLKDPWRFRPSSGAWNGFKELFVFVSDPAVPSDNSRRAEPAANQSQDQPAPAQGRAPTAR